jgi:hypothetical protein
MIVSTRGDRLLMVRQVDHQTQCGFMAEAWGSDEFSRMEPWDPLVTAAAWHDEGWRAWDDSPEVAGDGVPIDFPDLDRSDHVALYARGIDGAVTRAGRAGLLVSMHGQGLYESRLGIDGPARPRERQPAVVRAFLEAQERLQARLLDEIAAPDLAAWAWDGYRLLQAWDLLSLHLLWCGLPKRRTGTLAGVPRHAGDVGADITMEPDGDSFCVLRPYPFPDDELVLPVAGRLIPNRRYSSDQDLRETLAEAPWITVEVGVRRHRGMR